MPAAVVDHDEVPVAAHPAGADHGPGRRGATTGSRRDADVDPLVHPAPAPAEAARDHAVHRPDEARRDDGAEPVTDDARRPGRPGSCALARRSGPAGLDLVRALAPRPPARPASVACLSRRAVASSPLAPGEPVADGRAAPPSRGDRRASSRRPRCASCASRSRVSRASATLARSTSRAIRSSWRPIRSGTRAGRACR